MRFKILSFGVICLLVFSTGCIDREQLMRFIRGEWASTTLETVTTTITTTSSSIPTTTIPSTTLTTTTSTTSTTTTLSSLVDINCERKWDPVARDRCYRDLAVQKEDPRICKMIEYRSSRDGCYYRVALVKRDPTLCNYIWDSYWRERCHRFAVKED